MHLRWFRREKPPEDLVRSGLCCLLATRAGSHYVRIGVSHSPAKRLRLMQSNCPLFITLDAIVWFSDKTVAEYAATTVMDDLSPHAIRLEGNWFKAPSPIVIDAVEKLRERGFSTISHTEILDAF